MLVGQRELIDKREIIKNLIICFFAIELLFYFLNRDLYFQLSGLKIPIVAGMFFCIVEIVSNRPRLDSYAVSALLLMICVVGSAVMNYQRLEMGYLFSYLLMLVMIISFSCIDFSKKQFDVLLISYVISAVVISLIIIVFRRSYYELDVTRLTIRIGSGPRIDPNYLSSFLVAPILLLLFKCIKTGGWIRVICVLLEIICCGGVFLTGSRGALLSTVLGVLIYFILVLRRRINIKHFALFCIAILILLLIASVVIPKETLLRLFDVGSWNDGSNSKRIDLWEGALKSIKASPILGQGICSTTKIIIDATGSALPSHNTYLEMWLHMGLPGLVFFFSLIAPLLFNKKEPMSSAICCAILCASIFIAAEATFAFWFDIVVAMMLLKYKTFEMNEG